MTVLSNLPAHLMTVLLGVIGFMLLLSQVGTITQELNSMYVQMSELDYCIYQGEAFDRVFTTDPGKSGKMTGVGVEVVSGPKKKWSFVSSSWKQENSDHSSCDFVGTHAAGTYWTPGGKETLTVPSASTTGKWLMNGAGKKWGQYEEQTAGGIKREEDKHFLHPQRSAPVKFLLAQLFGLGIPIGIMMAISTIGRIFVYQQTSGEGSGFDSVIGRLVVLIVMVMLISSVFGVLTGAIQEAFNSIDANRFALYDNPVGKITSNIIGFWAVLFIAGFIPIAFSMFLSKVNEKAS